MNFGEAIELLKAGKSVRRPVWHGVGVFIFLVQGSKFKVSRPPLLGLYKEGTEVSYQSHVDMRTATGEIVPWVCSHADMLADDWYCLG